MRTKSFNTIKLASLLLAVAGTAILALPGKPAVPAADQSTRQPVLVELFTSEGCSSCPPADAVLAKLDAMQPAAGAQAIVLSEHVTYWDRLGWRDPFSLEAMTQRQQQYATQFGTDEVYTPQIVIDGATQLVGSDERGVSRAVTKAASVPKQDLSIGNAQLDAAGSVRFTLQGNAANNSKTRLVAVLAEDTVQSQVARGENAGRNLRHVAVVRVMQTLEPGAEDGRMLKLSVPSSSQPGSSQPGSIRLVVFRADKGTGHVLAVSERTLSRP